MTYNFEHCMDDFVTRTNFLGPDSYGSSPTFIYDNENVTFPILLKRETMSEVLENNSLSKIFSATDIV